VAFENLKIKHMEMNGNILFNVDDSFYTSEIFQSFVAFIGDILKPTMSWILMTLSCAKTV
jgi:hypothetical protein